MYRHGFSNSDIFNAYLGEFLEEFTNKGIRLTILGDINLNLLDSEDKSVKNYKNVLNSVGYSTLINRPTRIFRNEGCSEVSSSCLDHIVSNDYDNFSNAGILISDVSDHLPIFGNIQISNPKQNLKDPVFKRSFPEHKKDKFLDLLTEEMTDINFENCPNTIMSDIMKALQKVLDFVFPKKKMSRKRKKLLQNPWITKEILKKMKTRDKLYRKFVKNDRIHNSVDHVMYKKARNKVNRAIKVAKDNYFQKQFGNCHGDTRKMWKVLNNAMKRKSKKSSLPNFVSVQNSDGKLTKTNCKQSIANSMNKHFRVRVRVNGFFI